MRLGALVLRNRLFVAPMAGVTDRPFRVLCRRFGAGLAFSEMVSARPELRATRKSRLRLEHAGEPAPIAVQIVGADPAMMADAARYNMDQGAQIIDINMGCPAKKVCGTAAGSALLADEARVAAILEAVVGAVAVPVTLKIRTGPDPARRNAVRIARLAEQSGVQLVTIHGRTRACGFSGPVEYESIAAAKAAVRIPVIANGDLAAADDVQRVLAATGADGVMIGRAAHGRPWIFRDLERAIAGEAPPAPLGLDVMRATVLEHLEALCALYGEPQGVRIARKHIGWYARALPGGEAFRQEANRLQTAAAQQAAVQRFFDRVASAANDSAREPVRCAA